MPDAYVSTHWHVKTGREQEFVDLWHESLEWTKDTYGGDFERARLLRDEDDASHFVSFIEWDDREIIARWSDDAEKQRRQSALEEMCDDVHGSAYVEATRVG